MHVDFVARSDFPGQCDDLSLGGPLSGSLERVNPVELDVQQVCAEVVGMG